jgi:hypothetical protein
MKLIPLFESEFQPIWRNVEDEDQLEASAAALMDDTSSTNFLYLMDASPESDDNLLCIIGSNEENDDAAAQVNIILFAGAGVEEDNKEFAAEIIDATKDAGSWKELKFILDNLDDVTYDVITE